MEKIHCIDPKLAGKGTQDFMETHFSYLIEVEGWQEREFQSQRPPLWVKGRMRLHSTFLFSQWLNLLNLPNFCTTVICWMEAAPGPCSFCMGHPAAFRGTLTPHCHFESIWDEDNKSVPPFPPLSRSFPNVLDNEPIFILSGHLLKVKMGPPLSTVAKGSRLLIKSLKFLLFKARRWLMGYTACELEERLCWRARWQPASPMDLRQEQIP